MVYFTDFRAIAVHTGTARVSWRGSGGYWCLEARCQRWRAGANSADIPAELGQVVALRNYNQVLVSATVEPGWVRLLPLVAG